MCHKTLRVRVSKGRNVYHNSKVGNIYCSVKLGEQSYHNRKLDKLSIDTNRANVRVESASRRARTIVK